ncbi:MAG: acetylesterase, partial [Chloroflexi bacterium]|nr:acetylesterase [Chloroflexota bacterium]
PRLYAAIGLDDDLLPTNRIFAQRAKAYGLPLTYIEDEGKHTWPFWQKYLPIWLDFVLADDPKAGLYGQD